MSLTGRVFASVAHNRRRRTLAATTRRAVALHGLAPQASISALGAAGVLDLSQESTAGRQAATWCAASHDGENSSVSKHRASTITISPLSSISRETD